MKKKNVQIGELILEISFDNEILDVFGNFFDKYVVTLKPKAKLKIKFDSTLIDPDFKKFSFKKDVSTKISKNLILTKSNFSKGSFDLDSLNGVIYFPKINEVSKSVVLMYIQLISAIILLIHYDSLMFHASGALVNNEGLIFLGYSGIGKTTIALKAKKEGYQLFGDDCVGVNLKSNTLFSTFFKINYDLLEHKANLIVFLKQDIKLKATNLTFKDAFYKLINNNHLVLFLKKDSKTIFSKMMSLTKKFLEQTEYLNLSSRLEDEFEVILDEIEKKRTH